MDINELKRIANLIRKKLVIMSHKASAAHLGSSLSCVDILVSAYWGALKINPKEAEWVERDRFILSKGHAAAALYAVLAYRGFFSEALLENYAKHSYCLPEHPAPKCVPGIDAATGSLGHGLSIGLGMAIAGRIKKQFYNVYVLMSDGECNEGSVWEAAMFASAQKLDNVTVIIDYNKWQATGRSNEIMALAPLKEKWESFGWDTYEINGHDIKVLVELLKNIPNGKGKPVAIIANTVKGKGVSFMEDDNNWHYRVPKAEEVKNALSELNKI